MPLCGPAGSHPKPGVQAVVIYAAGGLALIMQRLGWKWLDPFIPTMGLLPFATEELCRQEPPGFEALTAEEMLAFFALDPIPAKTRAIEKVANYIRTMAWYELCECVDAPTPAEPPPLPAPPNAPVVINPPGESPLPCLVRGPNPLQVSGGQSFSFRVSANWVGLNPSLLRLITPQSIASGTGASIEYTLEWTDETGVILAGTPVYTVPAATPTFVVELPIRAGAYGAHVNIHATGSGNENTGPILEIFCNGQLPGVPVQPCCPPDPAILAQLDILTQLVTLIQRQDVPFGYVPGTAHVALQGIGELAVQGLIGYRVELTTQPAYLGHIAGRPVRIFDAGWVSVGTVDGFCCTSDIRSNPQLVFPKDMGAMTRIGYSFEPNVVATILELRREP